MAMVVFKTTFLYGSCVRCSKKFAVTRLPNKPQCGHMVCDARYLEDVAMMNSSYLYKCSVCDKRSEKERVDTETVELRENLESLKLLCKEVQFLRNEVDENANVLNNLNRINAAKSIEKEKMRKAKALSRIGAIKCSECEKSDNELNMQTCHSCLVKNYETLTDYCAVISVNQLDFNSIAICPLCAIRNHMKKGHEIRDFFPILRFFQFGTYLRVLTPKRESVQRKIDNLKMKLEGVMIVIGEREKQLDRMTEMLGRSKTSALQKKVVTKLTQRIEENDAFLNNFGYALNVFGNKIEAGNDKLKVENDVEIATNCIEA